MPFYESIHCAVGTLKIEINEQYVWHWLTLNNKDKFRVKDLCYTIEQKLQDWDWSKALHLDTIILTCYKEHEKRYSEISKHQVNNEVLYGR
jgi:hypothetical protein